MQRRRFLAGCAAVLAAPRARAQQGPAKPVEYRGVYATINTRPAQEMVRRLAPDYGTDRRAAIREVLGRPSIYMPPVLYALASTLAEDHAEQAIFWYHVGRLRAVYDALRCKDASSRIAVVELGRTLSLPLRQNQFFRRDRLPGIAQKAVDWDDGHGRDYDIRWPALYGNVAKTSAGTDPGEVTVPESEWPAILKHVHEAHLKAVQDFASEKK